MLSHEENELLTQVGRGTPMWVFIYDERETDCTMRLNFLLLRAKNAVA